MNFGFTEEQDELRRQTRRFLDQECPLETVRAIMAAEAPHDRGLWKKMGDLGWLGLTVSENYGGLGLSWEDLIVVAEEMGRTLFPSPFLANTAAQQAIVLLGTEEQKTRLLPPLCDGSRIATIALLEESDDLSEAGVQMRAEASGGEYRLTGKKLFVEDGGAADLLLVAVREGAGVTLLAVPRETPGIA
ncbi:MAG: acyl-CoA/acyl-ACP dehydrogenase, partial [Candidatus Methylomirabilis sp.]|nr:acyl-CoA/acyl-ACP dehydrogenase [Deltaproteobacteria bacterium]